MKLAFWKAIPRLAFSSLGALVLALWAVAIPHPLVFGVLAFLLLIIFWSLGAEDGLRRQYDQIMGRMEPHDADD